MLIVILKLINNIYNYITKVLFIKISLLEKYIPQRLFCPRLIHLSSQKPSSQSNPSSVSWLAHGVDVKLARGNTHDQPGIIKQSPV